MIAEALSHPVTIVVLDVAVLALMAIIAIAIIINRSIFAVIMLSGAYSLLAALFFVITDAVDVAFTEAAVGAGVSTVLMLGAMMLTAQHARPSPAGRQWSALFVVLAAGAVLAYAMVDMPKFGDPEAPANAYLRPIFLERTMEEVGTPNVVTAVLASYRGFDTLGEAYVIFTAGLGVMLILGLKGRKRPRRAKVVSPASVSPASGSASSGSASSGSGNASSAETTDGTSENTGAGQ